MAVWHQTYAINNVTPTALRVWGTDKRVNVTAIIQNSGHSGSDDVLLGGPNMNPLTESYGHRLAPKESLTVSGHLTYTDAVYAMSSGATGEVHVLVIGA